MLIETLSSVKATTLYSVTPVLMPFDTPVPQLAEFASQTNVDCIVAAAGSLPLEPLLRLHPGLKHIIWVAERSSRHMDWNEVPEGVGGKSEITVWHEIVEEKRSSAPVELPSRSSESSTPNIIIVSTGNPNLEQNEVVEYTQKVLISLSSLGAMAAEEA